MPEGVTGATPSAAGAAPGLQAPSLEALVERARSLDAHAVAQLVSVFQDRRPSAPGRRAEVLRLLAESPRAKHGTVIGVTGTPGAGKSSLLGRIAVDLLKDDAELSIAVLAIDPSSHISGGALLGDRTRLKASAADHRLYFRSEASDTELGGLSPSSFQVCRLLGELFDCVLVETVGIGQSEADIRFLAQHVFLVIAPLGGDDVQFLKAGIIEVPDSFIINKCDEPTADRSYHQLRASLWMARPFDAEELPIHRTSAKTGAGLDELEGAMRELIASRTPSAEDLDRREAHFFGRWVKDEWGRAGTRHLLTAEGGAAGFIGEHGGFDAAQAAFNERFAEAVRPERALS